MDMMLEWTTKHNKKKQLESTTSYTRVLQDAELGLCLFRVSKNISLKAKII